MYLHNLSMLGNIKSSFDRSFLSDMKQWCKVHKTTVPKYRFAYSRHYKCGNLLLTVYFDNCYIIVILLISGSVSNACEQLLHMLSSPPPSTKDMIHHHRQTRMSLSSSNRKPTKIYQKQNKNIDGKRKEKRNKKKRRTKTQTEKQITIHNVCFCNWFDFIW